MKDFILTIIILAVVGGACFYIYREKKNGKKCIGCPYANECGTKSNCNCNSNAQNQ